MLFHPQQDLVKTLNQQLKSLIEMPNKLFIRKLEKEIVIKIIILTITTKD